jgi:hypothetical protein
MTAIIVGSLISVVVLGNAILMMFDPRLWLVTWNRFIQMTTLRGQLLFQFSTEPLQALGGRFSVRLGGVVMAYLGIVMLSGVIRVVKAMIETGRHL